jgi:tellurite resistance protein TehA-like permease
MDTSNLKKGIQTFSPAYFALPMSTGIISIASKTLGFRQISNWLFLFNNIEFAILLLLLILRVCFFFKDFVRDLSSHAEGAGFLTVVAASCILGTEYLMVKEVYVPAVALFYFALATGFLFTYSFFILVTIKKSKPSLENGINGSWLLFVVSVQSISILGNVIAPYLKIPLHISSFVTLFFYLLGVLFYIIVIGIIFYRTTFFPMKEDEFKPSYWIDMGAAAITTLAGIILIKSVSNLDLYKDFVPTIKVFSVLFWIAGTWWIPVIFFLEIWRHRIIPFQYNAGYWALVFPLGVYTDCTWQLANLFDLQFLKTLPEIFIYVAWAAWIVTFAGMCIKLKSFIGSSTVKMEDWLSP